MKGFVKMAKTGFLYEKNTASMGEEDKTFIVSRGQSVNRIYAPVRRLKYEKRKELRYIKYMSLRFCSLSSGSRGNCYLVWTDDTTILIDAGISGKKIFQGLSEVGKSPDEVKGLLLTHEHIDHVKSVSMVCKKSSDALVYANESTWEAVKSKRLKDDSLDSRYSPIVTMEEFSIDEVKILPIKIHHDAVEPVGYSFEYNGRKLSIVTDTGHICRNIFDEIKNSHLLVLESNHEENILEVCDYPYEVKKRILSDYGHLSNKAAAQCIGNIIEYKNQVLEESAKTTVLLAHLSKDNNTPEMAILATKSNLEERGLLSMDNIHLDVVRQDTVSKVYKV